MWLKIPNSIPWRVHDFADIPAGSSVFLDANTFVYHFAPDPVFLSACDDLLIRIKRQEIEGYTSTHIIAEVAHRLMTIEAMKAYGWPVAGIVQRLRKNAPAVQKLSAFRDAIQEVPIIGIHVLTIAADLIDVAAGVNQQTGLLTNDALVVAVMQRHSLTGLASNDADFDSVAGLSRFAPL